MPAANASLRSGSSTSALASSATTDECSWSAPANLRIVAGIPRAANSSVVSVTVFTVSHPISGIACATDVTWRPLPKNAELASWRTFAVTARSEPTTSATSAVQDCSSSKTRTSRAYVAGSDGSSSSRPIAARTSGSPISAPSTDARASTPSISPARHGFVND